jgi:hypothetical protein
MRRAHESAEAAPLRRATRGRFGVAREASRSEGAQQGAAVGTEHDCYVDSPRSPLIARTVQRLSPHWGCKDYDDDGSK